jgi:hypothetical protein
VAWPERNVSGTVDLQNSRVPFDVVTGKRIYTNMLIRALEVTTDRTSENVVCCADASGSDYHQHNHHAGSSKEDMKLGANTSAVQNSGVKTPGEK